jgi:hypothetical protein
LTPTGNRSAERAYNESVAPRDFRTAGKLRPRSITPQQLPDPKGSERVSPINRKRGKNHEQEHRLRPNRKRPTAGMMACPRR